MLRTFTDRDGVTWNVWNVAPGSGAGYQERYRDGWVCFDQVDGGGRCRVPVSEVPTGWETMSDDRLDLLRRVAASSSTSSQNATQPVSENERIRLENEAQLKKLDSPPASATRRSEP